MSEFGRHVRRVREFLGLSQIELARRAGVSQVAVSRFEGGRGLNTAFVITLRINMALARALREVDPAGLTEDVKRFLAHMEFLALPADADGPPRPGGADFASIPITTDPELERLARIYREVPPARRARFVRALEVLAAALRD